MLFRTQLAMIAVALGACSGEPTAVSSESSSITTSGTYLALGDSIAFGFNPNLPYAPPFSLFVGYPEVTGAARALVVANAACPGETSGSFLDAAAADNGCHSSPFYFARGLKVDYQGVQSQMGYALAFLASAPRVDLITIDLGGNDLLLVQNACGSTNYSCIAGALPGALATFATNLGTIFSSIRAAGYTGKMVIVTQYATNYRDPTQLAALTSLNAEVITVAALYDVAVADGYGSFAVASALTLGDPCAAGLLIRNPDGTCDKHPSTKGRQLLANAVLAAAK
jgi:lysophospholipase L1-like esterase